MAEESLSSSPNDFKKIERSCRQCGAAITLKCRRDIQRKFYCSRICNGKISGPNLTKKALERTSVKNCAKCGSAFSVRNARHKYCSHECQLQIGYQNFRRRHSTPEGYLRRLLRPRNREHISVEFLMQLYIAQGGLCAISGIPMTFHGGVGYVFTNASIDQIEPAGGYTRNNIQLACFIVNYMKRNMSMSELKQWCRIITERDNAGKIASSS